MVNRSPGIIPRYLPRHSMCYSCDPETKESHGVIFCSLKNMQTRHKETATTSRHVNSRNFAYRLNLKQFFFHWFYSPCGPWPHFSLLIYS
jgi:hypothetical protein